MAANTATVVGIGGTTVTLNWQTASNAAIAQTALEVITGAVSAGTMQEVSYTGGSTLPASPSVPSVVLAEGAGSAAHGPILLGGNYQVGISNDTSATPAGQAWVVPFTAGVDSVAADTIFVGGGGGDVANFGTSTKIFLAGQGPQSVEEIGLVGASSLPSAEVWMDGNATINGSAGSTTVHLDTIEGTASVVAGLPFPAPQQFASTIFLINDGNGQNTVDIASNATSLPGGGSGGTVPAVQADIIALSGIGTTATTINAGGSAGTAGGTVAAGVQQAPIITFLSGSANAFVNGGGADIVLFGAGALGAATLFGGSGTDINAAASGLIEAGTGGGSLLYASFTGATTLVGGGNNDVLATLAQGQFMQAGPGSETLASFNAGTTFWGLGVTSLGQDTTHSTTANTSMIGEIGGNKFDIGIGQTSVQANSIGGNTYQEAVTVNAVTNVATITGFNVGTDSISLVNPRGGNYSTITGSSPAVDQIGVQVSGGNSVLHFGDGTTWTVVGATSGIKFG